MLVGRPHGELIAVKSSNDYCVFRKQSLNGSGRIEGGKSFQYPGSSSNLVSFVTNDVLNTDHNAKKFADCLAGKFFSVQLSSPLKSFPGKHFNKCIQVSTFADLPQIMAYNGLARQYPLLNIGMKLSY